MAIIATIRHNSASFAQSGKGVWTAWASDLDEGGSRPLMGRVYDDAGDEGFLLVSARTGKEVPFAVDHRQLKGGEVTAWHFRAIGPDLDEATKALELIVFNT